MSSPTQQAMCHIPESQPHTLPPHYTFLTTSSPPTPYLPTSQHHLPSPLSQLRPGLQHTRPWELPSQNLSPELEHSEPPDLLGPPDGPPTSCSILLNHSTTHFI
ncbi:uncharacterized protein EI90DRAFT_3115807 [Cantharellus anzutake]|uniref:uncharacterized protein n=1 Tax=Cantharellus anzutake TaxID=1750568 RepID=UPI001905B792|nr:uncharacterized protein EI90DRAFT_3115807 [Cantharellus anzutake]KAF8341982.1 hypothetical protein EI90DRAFT_3115807 [Cantharellus anzutake]